MKTPWKDGCAPLAAAEDTSLPLPEISLNPFTHGSSFVITEPHQVILAQFDILATSGSL